MAGPPINCWLVMVTVTAGNRPPLASVTVPKSDPVTPWAERVAEIGGAIRLDQGVIVYISIIRESAYTIARNRRASENPLRRDPFVLHRKRSRRLLASKEPT